MPGSAKARPSGFRRIIQEDCKVAQAAVTKVGCLLPVDGMRCIFNLLACAVIYLMIQHSKERLGTCGICKNRMQGNVTVPPQGLAREGSSKIETHTSSANHQSQSILFFIKQSCKEQQDGNASCPP
jgi:hypothetical protein